MTNDHLLGITSYAKIYVLSYNHFYLFYAEGVYYIPVLDKTGNPLFP